MSNNPRYFNAAIAGVGGGAKPAWISDPVQADYAAYSNAVNAAATAIDAAIPTVVGGASQIGADLLASICLSVFLGRNVSSTNSADYTTVANAIAALFAQLSTKQGSQPGNTSKILAVVVPAIVAPNTAQVSITDTTFIGANTLSAEFSGPPSATQLGLQGSWVGTSSTGAIVVSFIKAANNYPGATEQVRVAVSS